MNAIVDPQTETGWVTVCNQQDLIPNVGVCAKINDRQVAIFMVQDPAGRSELFAIDNYDPKSSANVLSRGIVGDLKGHKVVASPIYKNHFDLQTGACLEEDYSIPVYSVRNADGKIEVAV